MTQAIPCAACTSEIYCEMYGCKRPRTAANASEPAPQAVQAQARIDDTQPWTPEHCRSYPTEAARLLNARSLLPAQAEAKKSASLDRKADL